MKICIALCTNFIMNWINNMGEVNYGQYYSDN